MSENPEKIYKCKYCGKICKSNYGLTYHINVIHLKITKSSISNYINKKQCPKCKRLITIINFNKHLKSCGKQKLRHKDVKEILEKCIIKDNKYICPICNKEYSKMGIGTHIWLKHCESSKYYHEYSHDGYKNGTRVAWNKGLTKETDIRICKSSNVYRKNHILGKHKKSIAKDKESWKRNISIGINKFIQNNPDIYIGTYKRGFVKIYIYNGIKLQGTYELKFAIWCDKNSIKWQRNRQGFEYFYLNKIHKYFPDFYLPDLDEYVEVKGYKVIKDYFKWRQFPNNKKLNIVDDRIMKKLGIDKIIKNSECKNYL